MRGRWQTRFFKYQTVTMAKRSLLDISHYKNSYQLAGPLKHLSPLYGAIFSYSGSLKYFYALARNNKSPTVTEQVVLQLFHENEEKFRQTNNKSSVAYSLTPALLGVVMKHLHDDTLLNPIIRTELISAWKQAHLRLDAGRISSTKITSFLDMLQAAKEEYRAQLYPENYIYYILSAFLHYKAQEPADNWTFMQALGIDIRGNVPTRYTAEDIKRGKRYLNKQDMVSYHHTFIQDNMEQMVLALNHDIFQLCEVIVSNYRYLEHRPVANCVEAGYHNLCNILLCDDAALKFSFSLLPATLRPHPDLIKIYSDCHYQICDVNARKMGQGFMNLLSGHPRFNYCQDKHELETQPADFIPIMNFLFGSDAQSYEELSAQFSDDRRQVKFSKDLYGIEIIIKTDDQKEKIEFRFSELHGGLYADRFHGKTRGHLTHQPLASYVYQQPVDLDILFMLMNLSANVDDIDVVDISDDVIMPLVNNIIYFRNSFIAIKEQLLILSLIARIYDKFPDRQVKMKSLLGRFPDLLLHAVTSIKYIKETKFLIKIGYDLNQVNSEGVTPLMNAIMFGSSQTVKVLIESGAVIASTYTKGGFTLLHYAAKYNRMVEVLPLLMAAGLSVNARTMLGGSTPLMLAVMRDQFAMVKALIDMGADVNLCTTSGDSLLMRAIAFNHSIDIIMLLIKETVNINHANCDGKTALHVAVRSGKEDIVKMLLEKGAHPMDCQTNHYAISRMLDEYRNTSEAVIVKKSISP